MCGIAYQVDSLGLPAVAGQEEQVARLAQLPLTEEAFAGALRYGRQLGVTAGFTRIIDYFQVPPGHLPAGFRVVWRLAADGLLSADFVRDIGQDADGLPRPTTVLFSADTANPYELEPIAPLIANLTCNPGIIYDLFINNAAANIDHRFSTRDEVMLEIGRILGPGCDISIELNNPFEPDFGKILDECQQIRDILGEWRTVIKVPHTGPVSADNYAQLLSGDKRLSRRWDSATPEESFAGHRLALKLREHGFRVNFTLMFEPYQARLALQARPAFINSFIRNRFAQTRRMAELLERATSDDTASAELRDYLVSIDALSGSEADAPVELAAGIARRLVDYRRINAPEGADGLDCVRHNLRVLRQANLPDTRLIVCSLDGDAMYPDIDRLLTEPEFADMAGRVVVTAEPGYLARFASASQVVSYQRRFLTAAQGQR
ncbi:MAG: transaldolase family protein [Propionicimonas sp.]